jgi:cytochrome c oxidase assembly protein subunit 11
MTAQQGSKNGRSFGRMTVVAIAMFGFGYLLVPLYDVFCEITGLNGKTGRVDEAAVAARYEPDRSRLVTVQFVVNHNQGMPWEFGPKVERMQVHPGQIYAASYVAHNPTGRDMVAQAVPSVAPGRASRYFSKTECFCFDQQPLAAGETKEMPLRFIVDPNLPRDVQTLTLAYTVFDVTRVAIN